jgi:hypothetical protein
MSPTQAGPALRSALVQRVAQADDASDEQDRATHLDE